GMPLTGIPEWGVIGSPADAEQHDAAAAIYDLGSDRVLVFGGKTNFTGRDVNQVLAFSFPANVYSLNFGTSPLPSGNLNVEPYGTCYNSGASVTLTATSAQGFHFTGWSGSATGSNNPLMLTMDGDKSVTAHFAQPPPSC